MSDPERVELSRRIPAPAASIFAVITDPNGHVAIDGSGMLIGAPDARILTGVGDTFLIDMEGKFTALKREDYNSHCPMVDSYRRLLGAFNAIPRESRFPLSKENIQKVVAEWVHPDNRK